MVPERRRQGGLHLFLAAAPGAGKTYALLAEGRRLAASGDDVVIGAAETHGRPDTDALAEDLEVVPLRKVAYRGTAFAEMDLQAVLARRPQVVLVDELAHAIVPGGRHDKRWQDVEELLDAGIDVVSCLNVHHLESLSDAARELTGIAVTETVPDALAMAAIRVDLLDVGPEALRERIARLYPPGTAERALAGYFDPGNLAAPCAMGRRWVSEHGFDGPAGPPPRGAPVVAALAGEPEGEHVLRRAAQFAAAGAGGADRRLRPRTQRPGRVRAGMAGRPAPAARRTGRPLRGDHRRRRGHGRPRLRPRSSMPPSWSWAPLGAPAPYEALHGSVIGRTIRHAGRSRCT